MKKTAILLGILVVLAGCNYRASVCAYNIATPIRNLECEVDGTVKTVPGGINPTEVWWSIKWSSFEFDYVEVRVRVREMNGSWSNYQSQNLLNGDCMDVEINSSGDDDFYLILY